MHSGQADPQAVIAIKNDIDIENVDEEISQQLVSPAGPDNEEA